MEAEEELFCHAFEEYVSQVESPHTRLGLAKPWPVDGNKVCATLAAAGTGLVPACGWSEGLDFFGLLLHQVL